MARVLTSVLASLMWGAPAWADFKILDWSFDKDLPGDPPAGFAVDPTNGPSGRWEVRADPQSSSPPHVLARVPSDIPGKNAQVLFIDKAEAANLDITVRIKAEAALEGAGSGVVFRALDEHNYYVVWISPNEKLVRLDRVVNGEIKPLQDLRVESMQAGRWHSLRLSIHGPIMEAFFDSPHFLSAREDSWEHASYKKGRLGLWARGGGVTYFDNVRFMAMDSGTGSAPLGGTESTIIK